jgi:hypothetical protein
MLHPLKTHSMDNEDITPFVATSIAEKDLPAGAIERRKPKEAALALEMMAEGKTYDEVEAATGIGYGALVGLKTRHPETLEIRRKMLATDGFQVAEAMRQLVMRKAVMLADDDDQLKKVNIKDLMITGAIAQEKAFGALGENVVRVEHTTKKLSIEDAKKMIEEARAKVRSEAIETQVVEIKE